MHLLQITPGAGGMYCGNCFRDNALVAALRRLGHDATLVPLYLPMTLDETPAVSKTPTFFGGINVFLSQKLAFHRKAPSWIRRWFDSPRLLKWAAGKAAKTRPEDVGDLNVSMIRGELGNQSRELDEMIGWMRNLPKPDAIFLSNALLVGMARRLRDALQTRVICFLQSEESFLDSIPEPHRSLSWQLLAERSVDVDGWIAPTRYFADRMSERLGLPSASVHVVPNGISLEGYTLPSLDLARSQIPHPTLGFFSRLCPEKGLDVVVDAFIQLHRRQTLPRLHLKLGGGCGPSDRPYLDSQLQKLDDAGLRAFVEVQTNLSRDDKLAFLASCHILSVPSRISEAFGLPVIEAMAAGTPVVQPPLSGFPEILEATGGGLLAANASPGAIADAVETLFLDSPLRNKLAAAGRAAVHKKFSDSAMAEGILRATQKILSSPRPSFSQTLHPT